MQIKTEHLVGLAAGVGVSALGIWMYKKNQHKVNAFLEEHGIRLSPLLEKDPRSMTLKELVLAKEELEDLIAEKELGEKEAPEGEGA